MIDAPPSFPDASTRDRVRTLLSTARYSEAGLDERLPGLVERNGPAIRRRPDGGIGEPERGLALLLEVFRLGRAVPTERAGTILGRTAVEDLAASGLIIPEARSFRPAVHLSGFHGLVIASDGQERHRARATDCVLGPYSTTRNLAACAFRRPVSTAMDLGCGSGALATLAADWADEVVATDVNPRAVAFSRFNAALNGIENLDVREGSLFEPVTAERFDLILCNPPYVISPARSVTYRDGEAGICRRIMQEAPRHLTRSGYLQMLVEWPERAGSDWRAEPLSWMQAVACDGWLLRLYSLRAEEHARHWLEEGHGESPPEEATASWIEHLASLEAASVGGGVLVLRPTRSPTPVRVIRDSPPARRDGSAESLWSWISAHSLLAAHPDPKELLEVPLAPAPSLESAVRRQVADGGWVQKDRKLRLSRGFRFEATVDPVIEEIVGFLDGGRTPLEALERFVARHGLDVAPFLAGLPDALVRLLDLGLLVPAPDRTPPPD